MRSTFLIVLLTLTQNPAPFINRMSAWFTLSERRWCRWKIHDSSKGRLFLPWSRPNWERLCRRSAVNWEFLMPPFTTNARSMAVWRCPRLIAWSWLRKRTPCLPKSCWIRRHFKWLWGESTDDRPESGRRWVYAWCTAQWGHQTTIPCITSVSSHRCFLEAVTNLNISDLNSSLNSSRSSMKSLSSKWLIKITYSSLDGLIANESRSLCVKSWTLCVKFVVELNALAKTSSG